MNLESKNATVVIWVCVDNGGDYAVGIGPDSAKESYDSEVQSLNEAEGFRLFKLTLTVPLPSEVSIEAKIDAEETASIKMG